MELRAAGTARRRPEALLAEGYAPRHAVDLFGARFWLSSTRQNSDLRFFVGWIEPERGGPAAHARILYKDVSLVWRAATHWIRNDHENWIGKGDLVTILVDGEPVEYPREQTTDLPLEVQSALETLCRREKRIRNDDVAIGRVLRRAPASRLEPYHDFTAPRRRANADPRNRIHGGRPIAWFARPLVPESLRFARGFEPDLDRGVVERSAMTSRLYGGRIDRYRVLSTNRRVQYGFMAGPRHVWIVPAQATTTELSSYGVRTVDVFADEDLYVPGYEYHFLDEGHLVTQIPEGFAGDPSPLDGSRADASPWLDRLPIVDAFRRKVLGRRRRAAG
jgi:hypothetical protein